MKKRILVFVLVTALVFAMCGCDLLDKLKRGDSTPKETPQEVQMVPNNDLDFELQEPTDPGFSSLDSSPVSGGIDMEGLDTSTEPSMSDVPPANDDTMYTLVGDYAYVLDPNTFEPVGEPLDPITHEPINAMSIETQPPVPGSSTEGYAIGGTETNTGDVTIVTIPPDTTIPEEQKLPNTGVYLDDDNY